MRTPLSAMGVSVFASTLQTTSHFRALISRLRDVPSVTRFFLIRSTSKPRASAIARFSPCCRASNGIATARTAVTRDGFVSIDGGSFVLLILKATSENSISVGNSTTKAASEWRRIFAAL